MSTIIQFRMIQQEGSVAQRYRIQGVEVPLSSEGETIPKALRNLNRVVEHYAAGLGLPELPKIEVLYSVPPKSHL